MDLEPVIPYPAETGTLEYAAAPMRIEGVSALVAGGASGLGAATVRALHDAGARVVMELGVGVG